MALDEWLDIKGRGRAQNVHPVRFCPFHHSPPQNSARSCGGIAAGMGTASGAAGSEAAAMLHRPVEVHEAALTEGMQKALPGATRDAARSTTSGRRDWKRTTRRR